ncbi:MAG: hypothetical protein D6768_10595, partial [Chloroflexi bacterium]
MHRKQLSIAVILLIVALWLVQLAATALAQGQDLAVITEPASNAVLRETVQIVGSADYPSFQFYIVEF